MATTQSFASSDLLADTHNPRLTTTHGGQREALRSIASHQGKKLLVLAQDIRNHGMNPGDPLYVMPLKDDSANRHIVLEGNRRLAAIRALENPEWLVDAVDKTVVEAIRRLSKEYQKNPVELIACTVFKNRDEATHWIELRHTGENDGAGIVRWGSDEIARYRARTQGVAPHSQILDFLEKTGRLSREDRAQVPTSSLKRLVDSPYVRSKLGIDVVKGDLRLVAPEKSVVKALMYVVNDLLTGQTSTKDIYTKDQRNAYANNLPSNITVTPTLTAGEGVSVRTENGGGANAQNNAKSKGKSVRVSRISNLRSILIPRDCILNVTDKRSHLIERELRQLNIEDFPNAIGVLFRVFLELSTDFYITSQSLELSPSEKLRVKIQAAVNNLAKHQKLTRSQAQPLRTALQRDSVLMPSLDLCHDYVHSLHVFPSAGDLRATWDNVQPYFVGIWS